MKVLFVYNADKGVFSLVADAAHKTFSPSTYKCSLCALTYGHVMMKKDWKDFIKGLPESIEPVFMYKNQFEKQFSSVQASFPLIAVQEGDSARIIVSAEELGSIEKLDDLISMTKSRILQEHNHD